MSDTPPAPGDAGVTARLRRRTALAAWVPLTLLAVVAVTAWGRPGWATSGSAFGVAVLACALCSLAAGALIRRAARWRTATEAAAQWARRWQHGTGAAAPIPDTWRDAACGDPKPLHTGKALPVVRRERRLPAVVLPLRVSGGVLAEGQAVIVHARGDRLLPGRGDVLQVLVLGRRGPYLIGRVADGVVFAADRWMVGVG